MSQLSERLATILNTIELDGASVELTQSILPSRFHPYFKKSEYSEDVYFDRHKYPKEYKEAINYIVDEVNTLIQEGAKFNNLPDLLNFTVFTLSPQLLSLVLKNVSYTKEVLDNILYDLFYSYYGYIYDDDKIESALVQTAFLLLKAGATNWENDEGNSTLIMALDMLKEDEVLLLINAGLKLIYEPRLNKEDTGQSYSSYCELIKSVPHPAILQTLINYFQGQLSFDYRWDEVPIEKAVRGYATEKDEIQKQKYLESSQILLKQYIKVPLHIIKLMRTSGMIDFL